MNSRGMLTSRKYLNKWTISIGIVLVLSLAAAAVYKLYLNRHPTAAIHHIARVPQSLQEITNTIHLSDQYDVIVVGTDPEGVAAAVSASRNGLKTLLIDGRNRKILGGLMTEGWLNSIDMNRGPHGELLNKGIFQEWYSMVEGDSFDVISAANAFHNLVSKEKNLDLMLQNISMDPIVVKKGSSNNTIIGVKVTAADGTVRDFHAKAVIDATQDGDIAYSAGAASTYGREDIGEKQARMAVTLVFRLNHVTSDVWKQIQHRLKNDNDPNSDANEVSAYGYKEMYEYPPINKDRIRMRGLNIGRQNNDTALVNALQIFDIDGSSPKSRQEAMDIGKKEIPSIVAYMQKTFPEFSNVGLDGTAPEIYVRETRHLIGEYRLNIIDLLENRDQWDRIAFGSYPVDVQRSSPDDMGNIITDPIQYAVPYRSIVPLRVDGLLVVGRSASFDTLAHGSARVIPVGMATGQAAGAAVKVALNEGMTLRQLSNSKTGISQLQKLLNKQGMVLKPFQIKPQPYMLHKDYQGLKLMVALGLAAGSYKNTKFNLDNPSGFMKIASIIRKMHTLFPSQFSIITSKSTDELNKITNPLSIDDLSSLAAESLGYRTTSQQALKLLMDKGLIDQSSLDSIDNKQSLTIGDTYLIFSKIFAGLKLNILPENK